MTEEQTTNRPGSSPDAGPEDFRQALAAASALPLKLRLKLLDTLKESAVFEREDGLRFRPESLIEYKRVRRPSAMPGPMLRWLESLEADAVFYDIGANTGAMSLAAARAARGRVRVVAFEPAADSFAALVRNVAVNGLQDVVTPLHVALSDRTGVQPFHRASLGAGTALHALGSPVDYARNPFTPAAVEQVLAFRLDDLVQFAGLPRPTHIKLDVDGLEDRVLAGSEVVLTSGPCQVFTEVVAVTEGDPHPERVIGFLSARGFRVTEHVDHRPAGVFPRIFDVLCVREES